MEKTDWRDKTHPYYEAMKDKWEYTRLVYTGECFDETNIRGFLNQRDQGEGEKSYNDRLKNYDPELLFPMLIGSTAGQIHAVESDMKRVAQQEESTEGLGSWSDMNTPAGKLWANADGDGTNYPVFWRKFTAKLIYYMDVWLYADGLQTRTDADGERITKEPSIHMINPQSVVNWGGKGGRKTWVMVAHKEYEDTDEPDKEAKQVEKRTVYKLDGWKRYRKVKDTNGKESWVNDLNADGNPAEGSYVFYETKQRKVKTLPIFCVRLPFDQYLAYLLARKSVVLLNKESERDHLVRLGSIITKVDESSPGVYEEHKMQQREGETTHNYEPGSKLYFAAPPMDPAKENREIIKEKRENFFRTAYQQLNDQAAQVTATQIRQQGRAGIESLLSLISTTLDEAETRILFLNEQIRFPGKPELWGQAYAERSIDFAPVDPNEQDAMVRETWFGPNAPPATADMLHAIAVDLYERKGYSMTDEQKEELMDHIKAHIENKQGTRPGLTRIREAVTNLRGLDATNQDLQAVA